MEAQTEAIIREIESNTEIRTMAISQTMGLLQRELELRESLEHALQRAGVELPTGWIDWEEVILHFRRRAMEGIIRDELRRNQLAESPPHPEDLPLPDED